MKTKGKDLKWLSELSSRLVREIEEEERRRTAKAKELHSRMRAMALRIVTEAIAAEKKAKKK